MQAKTFLGFAKDFSEFAKAKTFLGFVKDFSEFAKGIYETCNFFNFALIIVVVAFAIVRLILFLHFTGNN